MVIRFVDTNTVCRVIWFEPQFGTHLIDINDPNAFPKLFLLDDLDRLQSRGAFEAHADPYAKPLAEEFISPKSREKRTVRWNIVKPLVENAPAIFDRELRGALVSNRAGETGTPYQLIYRDLKRYWQRGMTEQALTPDFVNCGGPGKRKVPGKRPLGRPGYKPSYTMTPETEAICRQVIMNTYAPDGRFRIDDAYKLLLLEHFTVQVPNIVGELEPQLVHPYPSLRQFTYVMRRSSDLYALKRRREGFANVEKDNRAVLGSSIMQTLGPGSRFEIDATIANFRLRSRTSRRTIGRPVVYLVVDVFSRLIVGIYIGLEWASWAGAMQALANVACNKVEYCRQYGITITEEQWPGGFLPEVILGDGGEVAGPKVDILQKRYNVTSETAEPGRGDRKGVVEKKFDMVPVKIEPFVGGKVDRKRRGPVTKHHRDGEYDIDGFTQAMIESVLYFNNKHQLVDFNNRPTDMIADDVPAIPLKMFNWGLRNRSGRLRQFEYEDVCTSLMEVVEGRITESGFEVRGLYYTCDKKFRRRLFEQARQNGVSKAAFSVDHTFVGQVFWHANGTKGEFVPCDLTPAYRQYEGMTRYEVDNLFAQSKEIEQRHVELDLNGQLALIARLKDIEEEQSARATALPDISLTDRDRNARANRKAERNEEDHRKRAVSSNAAVPTAIVKTENKFRLPAISKLARKDHDDG